MSPPTPREKLLARLVYAGILVDEQELLRTVTRFECLTATIPAPVAESPPPNLMVCAPNQEDE